MIEKTLIVLLLAAIFACATAYGALMQSSDSTSAEGALSLPFMTFTFDFPQSSPAHYVLSVDSKGRASYVSGTPPKSTDDGDDTFHYDFKVSDDTEKQIFDLAQRANYFQGEFEKGKGKIANTGMKTLSYKDNQRASSATFNYTTNPAAQELVRIFQSISASMEFAERLDHFHRYQKLALDDEVKRMEQMVKENSLMEVQAIAPILKQIIADQSVVNATRARAERILLTVNVSSR